jgi:hypothetical protein
MKLMNLNSYNTQDEWQTACCLLNLSSGASQIPANWGALPVTLGCVENRCNGNGGRHEKCTDQTIRPLCSGLN